MMYNIFISHSWNYSNQYEGLLNLLKARPYFEFKDYSVPKNDPIHNAPYDYQLRAAIKNQMQHASCVIVLAGVYASCSKWIDIEIDLAKELNKKIIAVEPYASSNTSAKVKNAASEIVKWNTDSIVKAIRGF